MPSESQTAPTALICGTSGQEGAWLAQLLLAKGYQVVGTARDAQMSRFANPTLQHRCAGRM